MSQQNLKQKPEIRIGLNRRNLHEDSKHRNIFAGFDAFFSNISLKKTLKRGQCQEEPRNMLRKGRWFWCYSGQRGRILGVSRKMSARDLGTREGSMW